MKITGQILKENRERKGISVSEVAIATKINVKTIVAMEEGDVERLPPKTFLRGFVKAYASYLELDVESVLSTFFDEMGSTMHRGPLSGDAGGQAPGPGGAPSRPRPTSDEADQAINPKTSMTTTVLAVVGILLLVVLIVFFKNKMDSYERETIVENLPPGIESLTSPTPSASPTDELAGAASPSPEASPTPEASPGESPSESPSPSPTAEPSPSPTATPTPTPSPTATPTPTPTPRPSPSPSPRPSPSPSPSPSPRASPSPRPSPSPSPSPAVAAAASPATSPTASPSPSPSPTGRMNEIIIEALDSDTIDATIDGSKKKITLRGDQVHTIRARKVTLNLNDGGAVNVIVNGSDRGVPGDLGKPKRIELP